MNGLNMTYEEHEGYSTSTFQLPNMLKRVDQFR